MSRPSCLMNRLHRWYCRSGFWKRKVEREVLPWSLRGADLGGGSLGSGAWSWPDDRLATISVPEYRLYRNRSRIIRFSQSSHGQHQCQGAVRRCDGDAVSGSSIFWRSLVHDASPHTLASITGSAVHRGLPGPKAGWSFCRNGQHAVHIDEDLSYSRHNGSRGSRNIACQT